MIVKVVLWHHSLKGHPINANGKWIKISTVGSWFNNTLGFPRKCCKTWDLLLIQDPFIAVHIFGTQGNTVKSRFIVKFDIPV